MSTRRRKRVDWSDLNDWDDSTAFDDWGTIEVASDDHDTVPKSPSSVTANAKKTRSEARPPVRATSRKRSRRPSRQKRAKTIDDSTDTDDLIEDHNETIVSQSGYDDHEELDPEPAIINDDDKTIIDAVDHTTVDDDIQGSSTQVRQDLGSWLDQSSMMQDHDDLIAPTRDEEDNPVIKDDETGADDNELSAHLPSNNGTFSDETAERPFENDGDDLELSTDYDDNDARWISEAALNKNNEQALSSTLDSLETNAKAMQALTGVDDRSVNDRHDDDTTIEKTLVGSTGQAVHEPIDGGESSSKYGAQQSYNTSSDADTDASMMEFLGDDSDYKEMAKARQVLRQKHGLRSMMRFRPQRQALDSLAVASTMNTKPVPTANPFSVKDAISDSTSDSLGTESSYNANEPIRSMAKLPSLNHDDVDGASLPVEDYDGSTIADTIDHADNVYAGFNDTDIDKMMAEADIDDDDRIDLDAPSTGHDTGNSEYENDSLQFDDNDSTVDETEDGETTGHAPIGLSKRMNGEDEASQAEVELDVDNSAPADSTGDEASNDSKGKPKSSLGGLFKKFIAQAKSELHGGDEGEDTPQESGPAVKPPVEKREDSNDGEPRKKPSLKEIIGLLKSPARLFGLIRHTIATARKLSMIIGLVIALIIAWAGVNIPSVLDKGSASGQPVDEGTITVVKTAWRDSTAFVTIKNKSDMIAHVSGEAVVRSWAPSASPLTWIGARETASCAIPSTDVDPGATREIKTTGCSKPSGVWHRVKAELEYE